MTDPPTAIPAYGLYGETGLFPDVLHCERIADRAARLDWTIAPHRHANLHQFFLIGGSGAEVALDGVDIPVTAPTLLSVPRYVVHAFRFPRGQDGYVLSVPPEVLPNLLGPGADRSAAFSAPLIAPARKSLSARFESILEELGDTRPLRGTMLRAYVMELAATLVRDSASNADANADTNGAPDRGPPGPAERHMRAFERSVRRNLRRHRRVSYYAAELGLSTDHLGRICRSMTGLTAAAFLEARLMQEARRQLAYTRNSVSQVAYDLGYVDPAYFARAFRRVEGSSPSAYRSTRSGRES